MTRFEAMVSRLEARSVSQPRRYQAEVALLVLLGYAVLALLLGAAGLGLVALVGYAGALLLAGGFAWLVLLNSAQLLVLLGAPLCLLARAALRMLFIRWPTPEGEPIGPSQAPALHAALAGMRKALRGPRVHQVLLDDAPDASIVQQPRLGLLGFPRNTLTLGLPLLESLSPDEALAVVAHEYGHLVGANGHFRALIHRLRGTWAAIYSEADQWDDMIGRWLAGGVAWYVPYLNAYTCVMARAREYEADRTSAELVGARQTASALKRVVLARAHHQSFMDRISGLADCLACPPADLCQRWAARAGELTEASASDLEQALGDPGEVLDTHPALLLRLNALGDPDPQALPPPRAAVSAAEAWLGASLQPLRARLQGRWAEQVARSWAQRHGRYGAHMADLHGRDGLSAEEAYERLRLRLELEPEFDWRDAAVAAFNAQYPDHAGGLMLEGAVLLSSDNAKGLLLVERAMALDDNWTKPVCECAMEFWLRRGNDDERQAWQQRWNARHARDEALKEQDDHFDPDHALRPHGLDAATLAAVHEAAAASAMPGIAALYLVRRILPADHRVDSYVLGVLLEPWARWARREGRIVAHLARAAWPFPMMVVALTGAYSKCRGHLEAVPGARLALP